MKYSNNINKEEKAQKSMWTKARELIFEEVIKFTTKRLLEYLFALVITLGRKKIIEWVLLLISSLYNVFL